MFTLSFRNEKELNITLRNINFEVLTLISSDPEFFSLIAKEKYYMFVDYDKIKFDKYTFLVTKNNKKAIEMILLYD